MNKRSIVFVGAALLLCRVLPAKADEIKPFQLEAKFFHSSNDDLGASPRILLKGNVSDSFSGTILKTTQFRTGPDFLPKLKLQHGRFAPDVGGVLEARTADAAELNDRATAPVNELSVTEAGASLELHERTDALSVAELKEDQRNAPFELKAKENFLLPSLNPAAGKNVAEMIELKPHLAPDLNPRDKPAQVDELKAAADKNPVGVTELTSEKPIVAELPAGRSIEFKEVEPSELRSNSPTELAEPDKRITPDLAEPNGLSVPELNTNAALETPLEPRRATALLPELRTPKPTNSAIATLDPKRLPKPEQHDVPQPRSTVAVPPKPFQSTGVVNARMRRPAIQKPVPQVIARQATTSRIQPTQPPHQLSWDEWHRRLATIYDALMMKALERRGNPPGWCTVNVTVRRNHDVGVTFAQGEGDEFIAATLEAYRALYGRAELEFPPNSKRKEVRFSVENKKPDAGAAVEIDAKTIKGDVEEY